MAFFLREDRKRGESYDYLVRDELYALGVILYVLSTDDVESGACPSTV